MCAKPRDPDNICPAAAEFPQRWLEAAKLTVVDNEELDEGLLQQFLSEAKSDIASIKSAVSKILGMLESNDRLVFIDCNARKPRIPFIKVHEAGHPCPPVQDVQAGLRLRADGRSLYHRSL